MQGDQKKFSAAARQRAIKYLERNLPKIKDSYELAIVAYALAVSGSAKSDLAYRALKGAMKEEGGMIYWSRSKIETNKVCNSAVSIPIQGITIPNSDSVSFY